LSGLFRFRKYPCRENLTAFWPNVYRKVRYFPLLLGFLCFLSRTASSQVYTYVDEKGVRTFTNTPPKGAVQDLKVSGAPPAPVPDAVTPKASRQSDYMRIVEKYAPQFQLDPALVQSMITQESGFKNRAVSSKGARGLMQLMPATARRLGVRDSFDPEENIRGGMKHMRNLLDMFDNDLVLSLAAYNAGENLVQRTGRVPRYRETHDYVRSITKRYGSKHLAPASETPPAVLPMFRYVDRDGVLHLTNIAPVPGAESSGAVSPPGPSP
jgi:transglycosylase-like protein with SLT domain/uncharacterized protein DUF4124